MDKQKSKDQYNENFFAEVRSLLSFNPLPMDEIGKKNCSKELLDILYGLHTTMFESRENISASIDESYYSNRLANLLYKKLLGFPYFINMFRDAFYLGDFPSVETFNTNIPKSYKLLEEFSFNDEDILKLDNATIYHKSLNNRLFLHLLRDSKSAIYSLNEIDTSKLSNKEKEALNKTQNLLSLIIHSLYPIVCWNFQMEDDDKNISGTAKIYLERVAESLNPYNRSLSPKDKDKNKDKNKNIPYAYQIAACVIYDTLRSEIKNAKKLSFLNRDEYLTKGIAGLISSKDDWNFRDAAGNRIPPHKTAKKIIYKSLGLNEGVLNEILKQSNRDNILKKLKNTVEQLR